MFVSDSNLSGEDAVPYGAAAAEVCLEEIPSKDGFV